MEYELRQLSVLNGQEEYQMLQQIGRDENGFTNEVNGMSYDEYKSWLIREDDFSQAKNLPEGWIPQTTYFLYADNRPVGVARIRHFSSEMLESRGVGSFGYGIAENFRGKGFGTILFAAALEKCREHGYKKIRSFVHKDNEASNRIFLKGGAKLAGSFQDKSNVYEVQLKIVS